MGVIDTALGLLPAPAADFARTAHLDNPLNLFLVFLAFNLISSLFPSTQPIPSPDSLPDKPTQYNWRPKEHPSPVVWRRWTPKELEKFDGTNNELEGGKLLMAIRRKVFDVSSGKTFYGPGKWCCSRAGEREGVGRLANVGALEGRSFLACLLDFTYGFSR